MNWTCLLGRAVSFIFLFEKKGKPYSRRCANDSRHPTSRRRQREGTETQVYIRGYPGGQGKYLACFAFLHGPCVMTELQEFLSRDGPSHRTVRELCKAKIAAMPSPAMGLPAPSCSLLRYLRAQSETIACFGSSRGSNSVLGDVFGCPLRNSAIKGRQASKPLSTSRVRRNAEMQAGLLNFDAILPRLIRKQRTTSTNTKASVLAGSRRYSSDEHTPSVLCKPPWHERWWGKASSSASRLASRTANLKPEDLPPNDLRGPGSIFSPSRTQAAKAALEPRLRCTEVDENGEVILVDGEFKKSELIAKVWRDRHSIQEMARSPSN